MGFPFQIFKAASTFLNLPISTKPAQPVMLGLFPVSSIILSHSEEDSQLSQNLKGEGPHVTDPASNNKGKWSDIVRAFLLTMEFSKISSHLLKQSSNDLEVEVPSLDHVILNGIE